MINAIKVIFCCALFFSSFSLIASATSVETYVSRVENYFQENGNHKRLEYLQRLDYHIRYSRISDEKREKLIEIYYQTMIQFDGCGKIEKYVGAPRYPLFSYQYLSTGMNEDDLERIEICESNNADILIIGDLRGRTVSRYNMSEDRLEEIVGGEESVRLSFKSFGARAGDSVEFESGYGDVGREIKMLNRYNFIRNEGTNVQFCRRDWSDLPVGVIPEWDCSIS